MHHQLTTIAVMRNLCIILSALCGLVVVCIVIAVSGTSIVPQRFLAWAVPFLVGSIVFAWTARRMGRDRPN